MYGDQFGEFVCGYWDLKGQAEDRLHNSVLKFTEIKVYSFHCKAQRRLKKKYVSLYNRHKNGYRNNTNRIFLQRRLNPLIRKSDRYQISRRNINAL